MHFWGICCESGKRYAQIGGQKFRVTMAVLDPTSVHKDGRSHEMISVMVNRNGTDYLLCVLKHREIQQVNLNLIFDKEENVEFYCNRNGKVYLSGYCLNDSECDVLNGEDEYLCPLVEIKSDSENSSRDVSPVVTKFKTSTAKRSKKATAASFNLSDVSSEKVPRARELWHSFLNDFSGGEDDIDEDDDNNSDKDFSVDDEEYSSDSDNDEEEEVEVTDDDIEEVTLNGESSEEKTEIIQNPQESRKRKKKVEVVPQKRCKNSNFKVSSESRLENSVDDICLEDTESYDKDASSQVNSDVCSTPVPEKKVISDTVSSKKKSKKKKRKSEVSNISNNELQTKSLDAASTSKSSNPIVKLNGGVEIQEILVGNGPEAKNGKVLHVFYVGRLPNKSIFDSRLPAKKPFSFKLGTNQVIKGFDVGFEGMRAGGKRKIKVPPDMAYGKAGNDGIPPNTTLYFVVELTSVS